jgi:3-methyladenine DNA glycosylase AlkD
VHVAATVRRIDEALRAAGDAGRAEGERRYLKLDRPCLGVGVPATRRIVRAALRAEPPDHDEALAVAARLWAGAELDLRRAAVETLVASVDRLGPPDLPQVEDMVRSAETWALVDPLAIGVAGAIVARGVDQPVGTLLDRWAAEDSFWVRRLSLLALLPSLRASDAEWRRFGRYADAMLAEREFFVRKAIGWVLRDVSRRRPDQVAAWVGPRLGSMSGVTRREATKHLSGFVADPGAALT